MTLLQKAKDYALSKSKNETYQKYLQEAFIAGFQENDAIYNLKELNQFLIRENESILEMATLHMDHRAVIVLKERIEFLNKRLYICQ